MTKPPFDVGQVMQQAKEVSAKLRQVQEQLRHRTVEATVGGGMVTATVNGKLEVVKLQIDPQAVDPRDVDMLQDLIVAAVNEGMRRAQQLMQQEMQRVTGLPIGTLLGGEDSST